MMIRDRGRIVNVPMLNRGEGLPFAFEVAAACGTIEQLQEINWWCLDNLEGEFRFENSPDVNVLRMTLSDESDVLLFKLRWMNI